MERIVRVVFIGQERVLWKRLVLYVVTFGIYRRIWLYRIQKELDGHEALAINHRLNVGLLVLPIIGPSIVTARTARFTRDMLLGANMRYGPWILIYLATWIPIAGNLFFMGWTQDKLNRFWRNERISPSDTIEVDVEVKGDAAFRKRLAAAEQVSRRVASKYEKKKRIDVRGWIARFFEYAAKVGQERRDVRERGGSVPILPLLRPQRPPLRILDVSCGRCNTEFQARSDPTRETVLLCPRCGMEEILPSTHHDALEGEDPVAVPTLEVDCPKCNTHFHALHDLHGPTVLRCPECGLEETLRAGTRSAALKNQSS